MKGAQNGLERISGIPAPTATFVPEEGPRRTARQCDDVHSRNARVDLHRPSEWSSIEPSPPRERNSPSLPSQPAMESWPALRN